MVVTLTGNNSLLLSRRLSELTAQFIEKNGSLAVERIDAADTEKNAILEAVQSLPFLSPKKLVVVRDLSANKVAAEQIEQIISSAPTDTDLIFYEHSVDKRTVYYKILKAQTRLEEFNELEPAALPKWLVDEASKLGAKLSHADANYLVERVGPNQAILFNELEKLVLYSPEITKQNIELLTEKTPQSKIFDLLDATFSDNKVRALTLYEEQRAQRVEPQAILALLTWQLNLIALVKAGKGKSAATVASDANVNPYPLNKAQNLAAKITDDKLHRMVSGVFEMDYSSKTRTFDLDEALKTYITTL